MFIVCPNDLHISQMFESVKYFFFTFEDLLTWHIKIIIHIYRSSNSTVAPSALRNSSIIFQLYLNYRVVTCKDIYITFKTVIHNFSINKA